jgi:uncharacterized protein YdaU (DUF1376 family)
MSDYPYLPFWVNDYLSDCGHLSDEEHGRYLLLLLAMWKAPGGRIPNDEEWLARKFRKTVFEVREYLHPIIDEFCQTDGNWIYQKRLSQELEHALKRSQKNSVSAKSRWNKEKDPCERNANAMPDTQCERNAPKSNHNTLSKDKAAGPPQEGLTTLFGEVLPGMVEWGVTERQARSLLGKLLKEHLASDILDAFHTSAGKADPVAYMRAVLAKRGGKPSEDPELNQLRQQAKMLASPTPFAKSQAQRLPSGAIPKMVKLGLLPAETAAEYGVKS